MYNAGKRMFIRLLLRKLVLSGNSKTTSIDAFFNKRGTLGSFTRLWNNVLANVKSKCEDWSSKFRSLKKSSYKKHKWKTMDMGVNDPYSNDFALEHKLNEKPCFCNFKGCQIVIVLRGVTVEFFEKG